MGDRGDYLLILYSGSRSVRHQPVFPDWTTVYGVGYLSATGWTPCAHVVSIKIIG